MYITLDQLADLPGATELAQVASAQHEAIVDAALMEATLRGTDRSAWTSDEIAVADDAANRITEVIVEVDALIDGYVARRLPVVPVPVPTVLVTVARAIVRYELNKHLISDASTNPVARDYQDKLKLLAAIRDGSVTIGATDPLVDTTETASEIQISGDERVFSRCQTRGFR
jgi:phage gp36-like protein